MPLAQKKVVGSHVTFGKYRKEWKHGIGDEMKKITIWKNWESEANSYQHNRIEDEWIEGDRPTMLQDAKYDKSYPLGYWQKEYGFLIEHVVKRRAEIE